MLEDVIAMRSWDAKAFVSLSRSQARPPQAISFIGVLLQSLPRGSLNGCLLKLLPTPTSSWVGK